MTSRRSVQQYDQRVSRALQFIPGHVGGRVASAQPIRRRDGTVRRQAIGTAGAGAAACLEYDPDQAFTRTAFDSTHATFAVTDGSFGYVALSIRVQVDVPDAVSVDLRAFDSGGSGTTAPITVVGPVVAHNLEFWPSGWSNPLAGWRIEWDVPGALVACCAKARNNE